MNDKILTIKKSTLVDIANQVRAKTGSTDLIKVADLDDAVAELSGGGVVEVDVLPEPTVPVPGTQKAVPNSGYIDKVYLNTSLSNEEVLAEISKLPHVEPSEFGNPRLLACEENSSVFKMNLTVMPMIIGETEAYLIVDPIKYTANGDSNVDISGLYWVDPAFANATDIELDLGGIIGWNPDFNGEIEVNGEALDLFEYDNFSINIGVDNDKIVNLFYTSEMGPNPDFNAEAIYKLPNAPVPNSGPVVPIYFNRSLSTEEVIAEMDKLTYPSNEWGAMPYPVANIGGRAITIERYVDGDYTSYTIRESMGSAGTSTIFDSADGGWSEYYLEFAEFNNFAQDYEFTSEDNGYPIGDQNHLISNLFSIDPFPTPLWTYEDSKWQCYKKTRKITVINECSDPQMFSFYPDCEHLGNTDGGSLNGHYPMTTLQPGQSVELNVVNSLAIDNSNGYDFYDVENARILELQLSKNTYKKLVIVSLYDDNAVVHIGYQES